MVDANEKLRGLLEVARDLLAGIVERGLHRPEAAAVIRGQQDDDDFTPPKPPFATVTLAEIYAAQGHPERALAIVDRILATEPGHAAARRLRETLMATLEPPREAPEDTKEPSEGEENEDANDLPEAPPPPSSSSLSMKVEAPPAPEAPVPMLDDEPLPPRYEVDEVVALPVDPRTLYVYWEVREETLAEVRVEAEDGRLCLRVVAVTATWEGPLVETRDIEIQATLGDWFVRDFPPGAIPRVALGWLTPKGFLPLAIALDIGAPPEAPSQLAAATLARFSAESGAEPLDDPEQASAYTRAVERYRRKLARSLVGRGGEAAKGEADAVLATGEALPLASPSSPTSGGFAEV